MAETHFLVGLERVWMSLAFYIHKVLLLQVTEQNEYPDEGLQRIIKHLDLAAHGYDPVETIQILKAASVNVDLDDEEVLRQAEQEPSEDEVKSFVDQMGEGLEITTKLNRANSTTSSTAKQIEHQTDSVRSQGSEAGVASTYHGPLSASKKVKGRIKKAKSLKVGENRRKTAKEVRFSLS